jgi:glycerol-3-phosphate dehydrogenase subunit C
MRFAFFTGCTGRYLFPEVPKAAVEVLKQCGIDVFVPQQKCCSMPALLEGDRKLALEFVNFNLQQLTGAIDAGYDIICSCSTCGFMLKNLLREGAYYSTEYQQTVAGDETHLKVPSGKDILDGRQEKGFVVLQKSIYGKILKDEGYFSTFSAQDRIRIAEHTYDLGEYLQILQERGEFPSPDSSISGNLVYFPPCHGREQNIGRPYPKILSRIPNLCLESIDGHFYCCGMAGIMGFKREFHDSSIRLGRRLMDKIEQIHPDRIVTDCLSCRLQFNQCLPYPVAHPIEILRETYTGHKRT